MTRLLIAAGLLAVLAALAYSPATPLNAQGAGDDWAKSIKGRIVWKGPAPERKKIDVKVDKAACLAKGDILDEDYLVNSKNQG